MGSWWTWWEGRFRSRPVGLELKGVKAREGERRWVPLTLHIVTNTPWNEASQQGQRSFPERTDQGVDWPVGDAFVKHG